MRSLGVQMLNFLLIISWTNAVALGADPSSAMKGDPMEIIRSAGYSGEEHRVHTEDGYILTVHRLRPAPGSRLTQRRKRPVYLQHGLSSSSYYWLINGPKKALPFILSDEGYDVWMANSRGNCLSQDHELFSNNTDAFWDFSFHEMGMYDLPAVIDYILNVTGRQQVYYVGHSMGTTMFFVMASLRPDVVEKVHFMVALAPVATVEPIHGSLRFSVFMLRIYLKHSRVSILHRYGISKKTILHYIQLYLTGEFAMFDYGPRVNMQKYNNSKPLHYAIASIPVPVLICLGTEDPISTKEDMKILSSSLEDVIDVWVRPMGHTDFVAGRRIKRDLYQNIIAQLH